MFGGGGDRVYTCGSFFGGRRSGRGLRRRAVDAGGDFGRHALHILGRPRHGADHALDVGFETVGHLPLQRLLLLFGLLFGGFLRFAQRRASIMLRRNTSTAPAMVPSSSLRSPPGIVDVGIATREAVHDGGDGGQRARHAAAKQERQQGGGDQNGEVPKIR